MQPVRVAALLLAAGAGTRMGSGQESPSSASPVNNKLLLDYRGTPLVCHLARVAQTSRCDGLHVVVGANARDIARALEDQAPRIVENPGWASGLASSIRAGVAAIDSQRPTSDALVVLLADQPHVTARHIDALIEAYEHAPDHLVASRYAGVEGVPALFPRRCFEALMQLEGDSGARSLLAAERGLSAPTSGRLVAISFEPAAIDIDTPEDYAALRRSMPVSDP